MTTSQSIQSSFPSKYNYPESLLMLAQIEIIYKKTIVTNPILNKYIEAILTDNMSKTTYKLETTKDHISEFVNDFLKLNKEGYFEQLTESILNINDDDGLYHLKSFCNLKNNPEALQLIHQLFIKCHNVSLSLNGTI
jgi:hypothetical protein